jgi:hypothetical protein
MCSRMFLVYGTGGVLIRTIRNTYARAGQPVVLVADDDAIICKCLRIALEATGTFVLTASDGKRARWSCRGSSPAQFTPL